MGKMVSIGMPVAGKQRRFTRLTPERFLYSCPACTGLAANDQELCPCGQDLRAVSALREDPANG